MSSALTLLIRHTPESGPIGWDEVIAGYDFGLLTPGEMQTWVRLQTCGGETIQPFVTHPADSSPGLDRETWAACSAAMGGVPLPGHQRWQRAQDRWRVALIRRALATHASGEPLALELEAIYDQVGCPEDMLGLWTRCQDGSPFRTVNHEALHVLLCRLAPSIRPLAG